MAVSGTRDRSCASQDLTKLRLLWGRRGRDVVVEGAGLSLREMCIGCRRDNNPALVAPRRVISISSPTCSSRLGLAR